MPGELARTVQTFAEAGFLRSVAAHGLTAAYGGYPTMAVIGQLIAGDDPMSAAEGRVRAAR